MNLTDIKRVLNTASNSGGYYLLCVAGDNSYVYCTDNEFKIYFTSTDSHIRMNSLLEDSDGLRDLLKETANKLGRKFIEAEYPIGFINPQRFNDCNGNWNVRNLLPSRPEETTQASPSETLSPLAEIARRMNEAISIDLGASSLGSVTNAYGASWSIPASLDDGEDW